MTVDFAGLLYGPSYDLLGVSAELTLSNNTIHTLQVLDKTSGIEVAENNVEFPTIKPAAMVRVSELTEKSLTRADLRRSTLIMNEKSWRIEATLPKPSPLGEGSGELLLVLIEG